MKKILFIQILTFISMSGYSHSSIFNISNSTFELVKYTGDLSVITQTDDNITWDQCLQKFKVNYKIIVRSNNGIVERNNNGAIENGSEFSFRLKFELNGHPVIFYAPGQMVNSTQGIIVSRLGVNETRTIEGHVYFNNRRNLEGPDIILKASIAEYRTLPPRVIVYQINFDRMPRSNVSQVSREIPYLIPEFNRTEFDGLETLSMPISNQYLKIIVYQEFSYYRIGSCNGMLAVESPYYSSDFGLSEISFVKQSCFNSGIPYYFMKVGNKYVTVNTGVEVILTDGPFGSYSYWVFAKARSINGESAFYIYNVGLGSNLRIQVKPSLDRDVCLRNQLFMGSPASNPWDSELEIFYFHQ